MLATISRPNIRLRAFFFVSLLALPLLLLPFSFSKLWDRQAPTLPALPLTNETLGKLPLSFEPNAGQTDPSVRFLTHASGGTLYFTPEEVVLSLPSGTKSEEAQVSALGNLTHDAQAQHASQVSQFSAASVVRMQFVDANPSTIIQSGDLLPGKVNYFIGNDPSKWQANVPTYSGVTYAGLYPGVDLGYAGDGSQLKGTYTVAAGSDPSQIRWRYSGAEKVTVDQRGNLQITVTVANTNKDAEAVTVTEQVPVAWQEIAGTRMPVSARYLIAADQSIGFVLGSYDRNYPLIIDPTLTYSTYLGGSGYDFGNSIAVDTSGNAYVTGNTASTNFPLQNPFQPTFGGTYDVFVTKFSATGSTLLYSTYLGGSNDEYGYGIAVDTSGNAYVTGFTTSTNFPLQNPFQPTFGGVGDAFVTKFSATGSTLIYSTYLGGSGEDGGYGIAVDASGNAYVTGYTASTNFPLQNPFQPTFGGGTYDVFVTKFSATGSTLIYSTYLGGSQLENGSGIAVDASGNAYVTGHTVSTNFPIQNPFQPTLGGGYDAFVAKISREPCTLTFTDVPEGSTFYTFIRCLACRGIISGYADGTFRPNNQVTRGQLAKIVSNAAGFTEDPNPQMFEDVPPANTFYQWINRLARRGHMSGYPCGGVGEPCTTGMPYFRPFANATRGQTSKIVSNAAGYSEIPTDQTFEDVPATHTFYREIQRLATRNIMQGYPCGGVGEPCLTGRPYFRPANNVTRGQSAKIVANTFYPGCNPSVRP